MSSFMKKESTNQNARMTRFVLTVVPIVIASCAQTTPYINKNISSQVDLRDTPSHKFRYVNITEDEGALTVFGKVDHVHKHCDKEGHVDLAVVSKDNEVRQQLAMVLKQGSNRVRGWHSAAFRARLGIQLAQEDTLHLAFHDDDCIAFLLTTMDVTSSENAEQCLRSPKKLVSTYPPISTPHIPPYPPLPKNEDLNCQRFLILCCRNRSQYPEL